MLAPFRSSHFTDENDNPAGGFSHGTGVVIAWQDGPLGKIGTPERIEPNGAFVETILAMVKDRIEIYQSSKFAGQDNADAIIGINIALDALNRRTQRRIAEGVEGTHAK